MSRTSDTPLRKRLRQSICPFSGISPAGLEKHLLAIERVVLQAKANGLVAHRGPTWEDWNR